MSRTVRVEGVKPPNLPVLNVVPTLTGRVNPVRFAAYIELKKEITSARKSTAAVRVYRKAKRKLTCAYLAYTIFHGNIFNQKR
jgi:hypothetical protein